MLNYILREKNLPFMIKTFYHKKGDFYNKNQKKKNKIFLMVL